MGSRIRKKWSSAQLDALAQLEREIRSADPLCRHRYLRDFNEAFTDYEKVLTPAEFEQAQLEADILLVGDYHSLPRSQAFAAELVRGLAGHAGRHVVLGVEALFSDDQSVIDDWQCRKIGEQEFRERVHYDVEWGYPWRPFYRLLDTAREAGVRIYGLDIRSRGDLRRIKTRDRHAAQRLAEIHAEHPEAALVALFGEAHLAPRHLPALVRSAIPRFRVLTILQNLDSLYWKAVEEPGDARQVLVEKDVVCVFTATPMDKYESYRSCIERWT